MCFVWMGPYFHFSLAAVAVKPHEPGVPERLKLVDWLSSRLKLDLPGRALAFGDEKEVPFGTLLTLCSSSSPSTIGTSLLVSIKFGTGAFRFGCLNNVLKMIKKVWRSPWQSLTWKFLCQFAKIRHLLEFPFEHRSASRQFLFEVVVGFQDMLWMLHRKLQTESPPWHRSWPRNSNRAIVVRPRPGRYN